MLSSAIPLTSKITVDCHRNHYCFVNCNNIHCLSHWIASSIIIASVFTALLIFFPSLLHSNAIDIIFIIHHPHFQKNNEYYPFFIVTTIVVFSAIIIYYLLSSSKDNFVIIAAFDQSSPFNDHQKHHDNCTNHCCLCNCYVINIVLEAG